MRGVRTTNTCDGRERTVRWVCGCWVGALGCVARKTPREHGRGKSKTSLPNRFTSAPHPACFLACRAGLLEISYFPFTTPSSLSLSRTGRRPAAISPPSSPRRLDGDVRDAIDAEARRQSTSRRRERALVATTATTTPRTAVAVSLPAFWTTMT